MLKLRKTRRIFALTASALALAGGTAVSASGSAAAAVHPQPQVRVYTSAPRAPLGCYWTYIGDPGRFFLGGQYAGEVEQLWDNCGDVWSHWQWDSTFQSQHWGTAYVDSGLWASNGKQFWGARVDTTIKDVWVEIGVHATSPDAYEAMGQVDSACVPATGTMHDYSDGGTLWGPGDSHC